MVEGIKQSRGRESVAHRLSAGMFYKIMSRLLRMDMSASSDFKLLDRKVVDVLLALPERNTFFRALSFWAFAQRLYAMRFRRGSSARASGPSGAL